MQEPVRMITTDDVPDRFVELARDALVAHSVALCAMNAATAEASACGSATLVAVDGHKCLLTAAHVWELGIGRFAEGVQLGFGTHSREQALTVDPAHLRPLAILRPPGSEFVADGFDLALIELPYYTIGTLEAWGLFFYDFDAVRARTPMDPAPEDGLWIVAGAPGELGHYVPSDHFTRTLQARGIIMSAAPVGRSNFGDLDRYELRVQSTGKETPSDYGGVSGGGLWLVQIPETLDLDPSAIRPILVGVLFWQGASNETQGRSLYAQGPKALFEHLVNGARGGT